MTAKPTFFDIRNKIMGWEGLSLSTRVLWEHLCQMAWADGSCYPSTQTLARMLQISLRQIKQSKTELTSKGLVNVFHRELPQTDIFFPFVRFQNIDQRDKNITVLHSAANALCGPNDSNDLQTDSAATAPTQCSHCTRHSAAIAPIKEKIKIKDKIREEYTTNVVFVEHVQSDTSDTLVPAVETPPEKVEQNLTKKQRSEVHRAARDAQIAEIEANLQQYRDEYPTINVDVQFRKMVLWLTTKQKGKVRKDIRRTWINWLNSKLADYNVAQIGKQTPENKKLSQYEEYKKYVAKNANRP